MYGLVNQAVQDLAIRLGGAELWSTIVERAGMEKPIFVGMEAYDDALTYRLVVAASEVLGLSTDEVLEAFGEHWILYTGSQGYGAMLDAMGRTLPQFLGNLDSMHSRIALSMPELRPPAFACEELDEERLLVRYWSERPGLAPMVVGLLKGLGGRFDLDISVALIDQRSSGVEHDSFLVTYRPSASTAQQEPADSRAAAGEQLAVATGHG